MDAEPAEEDGEKPGDDVILLRRGRPKAAPGPAAEPRPDTSAPAADTRTRPKAVGKTGLGRKRRPQRTGRAVRRTAGAAACPLRTAGRAPADTKGPGRRLRKLRAASRQPVRTPHPGRAHPRMPEPKVHPSPETTAHRYGIALPRSGPSTLLSHPQRTGAYRS